MKTTFREIIENFDDDTVNTEVPFVSESVDIDIDKIKGEVLMRINNEDGKIDKKKSKKRIITLLVAAVLLITCTLGAFATGSVQSIFKGLFVKESNLNNLKLYEGENVIVNTPDDSLNIKLLGITGDEYTVYSAIEVTKKDGSAVIDEAFNQQGEDSVLNTVTVEAYEKDTKKEVPVGYNAHFRLSDNNRNITLYLTHYLVDGYDMRGSRVVAESGKIKAYKVDEVLESIVLPDQTNEDEAERFVRENEEVRSRYLDVENLISFDKDGERIYAQGEEKLFTLPFEVSFDVQYGDEHFIEEKLSAEIAPEVVESFAENVRIEITPLGIYLFGECKAEHESDIGRLGCFKPVCSEESKCIMNDGTVYYINYYEYGRHNFDEDTGTFVQMERLKLYKRPDFPYHMETIVVDTREIQTVIINGETVYSK